MSEQTNHRDYATTLPADGVPGETLSDRVRSLRLPKQTARSSSAWLPWLLCVLLAITASMLGAYIVFGNPLDLPRKGTSNALRQEGLQVSNDRTPADVAAGGAVLESKGYIIPAHQIQVSPKVGGMVIKLNVEEGKRVTKGDVLAELETVDYQADVDRAKAMLAAAHQRHQELVRNHPREIEQVEAELAESQAQLKSFKLDWDRNRRLIQDGSSLAMRDFEQAESSYRAWERRVERLRLAADLMKTGPRLDRIRTAEAEVKVAEAELTKNQWRLDNCTVRAPVTGTILTKKAEEGNIVNPAAFSNGLSASLCDMADLSDLEVDLNIQERDLSKVFQGQRRRVRTEAFPDRTYEGVVSRLMPIADRAKGAVPVRVKVRVPREEEGLYLKPEMGAVVSFLK